MGKFINPFTDVGFKHIFGREICKEVLIGFLNDLLVGERQIVELSFMDKEDLDESVNGRVVIFDILCKEPDGAFFIIEMQNQYQDFFLDRSLYYLCRSITRQGIKGKNWDYTLYPVYGIYFLNFVIPPLVSFRTDIILAERTTGKTINGKFRQIYLAMPFFTQEQEDCKTDFERWIYILKHMDTLERMPFKAQKSVLDKLLDIADVSKLDEKERAKYDEALKIYRDYYGTIHSAERKGKAEGRTEAKAEIALAMKQKGMDISTIADLTGLTTDFIATL